MILTLLAAATMTPQPEPRTVDPHVHFVRYEKNVSVPLQGYLGFQTTIPFEEDERIENVAIGDATSWQITPNKRADTLFLKPIQRSAPTNMVVITNKRMYSFALYVAPKGASTAYAAWVYRFILPPPPAASAPATTPVPITPAGKNANYTVAGPAALLPTRVFDDGQSTYFLWPEEVALPAIFAVNPDKSEAIVNFIMRDGYAIVQQTAGRFVLRQGSSSATITSTPGVEKRLSKPSSQR